MKLKKNNEIKMQLIYSLNYNGNYIIIKYEIYMQ